MSDSDRAHTDDQAREFKYGELEDEVRDQTEDQATVVVAAADGKRHGAPGVDLGSDEIHLEDLHLARSSMERIAKENLSAGEIFLAKRVSRLEELGSL